MRILLILLATLISTSALAEELGPNKLLQTWEEHWADGVKKSIETYGKAKIEIDCKALKDRCQKTLQFKEENTLFLYIENWDAGYKNLLLTEICTLSHHNTQRDCYGGGDNYIYWLNPKTKRWRRSSYTWGSSYPSWAK